MCKNGLVQSNTVNEEMYSFLEIISKYKCNCVFSGTDDIYEIFIQEFEEYHDQYYHAERDESEESCDKFIKQIQSGSHPVLSIHAMSAHDTIFRIVMYLRSKMPQYSEEEVVEIVSSSIDFICVPRKIYSSEKKFQKF